MLAHHSSMTPTWIPIITNCSLSYRPRIYTPSPAPSLLSLTNTTPHPTPLPPSSPLQPPLPRPPTHHQSRHSTRPRRHHHPNSNRHHSARASQLTAPKYTHPHKHSHPQNKQLPTPHSRPPTPEELATFRRHDT
ncbi:hypothetical protein KC19_4G228100 [Ceratodon purpureus]|uniref:Uncharacterized protein n=1 Tax=Ceratodon purpureus TaxID=3225 RepID=A0A8T0ICL7_CERPU|nr:hypothetical protein KC19_4G228100 [Ceratodon purpureus]